MDELSDEELLEIFYDSRRKKAERAFEVLVRRRSRWLHRYVGSMVGNPEDAFDVVQKTWRRVFSSRGTSKRWTPQGSTKAISWIARIAKNLAIDHAQLVWNARVDGAPTNDDGSPLDAWMGYVTANVNDPVLATALVHCWTLLQRKAADQHEVVMLRTVMELTWPEVMVQTGESNRPKLIRRHEAGLVQLKRCLQNNLGEGAADAATGVGLDREGATP